MVHQQEKAIRLRRRCTAVLMSYNSGLLVSMQTSLSPSFNYRAEREWQNKCVHRMWAAYVAVFHCSLTMPPIVSRKAQRVVTDCFLINSVCTNLDHWVHLDVSRPCAFILDLPLQLVIWQSYCIMNYLTRKKEGRWQFMYCWLLVVLNLCWYYCKYWASQYHWQCSRIPGNDEPV